MKTSLILGALVAGSTLLGSASAMAQSTPADDAPVGKAANTWMVRLRAIEVMPTVTSSTITLYNGTNLGGSVKASNAFMPEVDFSYFFTDNIAAELIAATTQHTLSVSDTLAGSPVVGQIWVLPPTLTLQYHFMPKNAFSPYLGVGINWTIFYNGSAAAPFNRLTATSTVGPALQAGVDWNFKGHWFLNADVKWIYMNTTASVNGGLVHAKTDLNPVVLGLGVGYRF